MNTATSPTRHVPEVYVLWHPDCKNGELFASRIYTWLRPGAGLGPDVFFRSAPRPDVAGAVLPLPLPGDPVPGLETKRSRRRNLVDLQILILLIDSHMVADPTWRYWLTSIADPPTGVNRVFLPVALESSAFNVPDKIAWQNFLRPAGLPLAADAPPIVQERVLRSLCRQLTEALCSMLLGTQDGSGLAADQQNSITAGRDAGSKITLFLSHAKVDGTNPARRIRDYIYANTQLAAFYDENDIPFGRGFSKIIEAALSGARTAALIVIRSVTYASRPWCRREIAAFRRPFPDPVTTGLWRLSPIVVVDALDPPGRETFGVPEFGNSLLVGWSDSRADLEEHIVTLVLREALLRAFHTALGRHLIPGDQSSRLVINWIPDPTTLLLLEPVRLATDPSREVEVCYPGRGLSALELGVLEEYFPGATFTSYEQALAS